jgi:hypothetical protein
MSASDRGNESAPNYDVPEERIVSIEHPCIVKNLSNGFKSLGGEQQLKHVSEISRFPPVVKTTNVMTGDRK